MQSDHRVIPALFLCCGTEDFLYPTNRAFHQFLQEQDILHAYFESPGIHDYDFWSQYLAKMMRWTLDEV